jgi:hypothetical protein
MTTAAKPISPSDPNDASNWHVSCRAARGSLEISSGSIDNQRLNASTLSIEIGNERIRFPVA